MFVRLLDMLGIGVRRFHARTAHAYVAVTPACLMCVGYVFLARRGLDFDMDWDDIGDGELDGSDAALVFWVVLGLVVLLRIIKAIYYANGGGRDRHRRHHEGERWDED